MPSISIDERALADVDRLLAFLVEHEVEDAGERLTDMLSAIQVLERHPEIGRRVEGGLRELVIGRRSRGYVALYRYDAADDVVVILAVRAQRERGYRGG